MNVQKSIGERIQQLRQANGWTQAELANLADCSKQLVSAWEAGRSEITVSSVVLLAQRLGIDPRWLLLGAGHGEPSSSGPVPIRHLPLLSANDLFDRCMNPEPQSRPFQVVSAVYGFPGTCFAMICEDDGVSRHFRRGDLLVIDPQAKPSPDAYVAAVILQDAGKDIDQPQIVVRRVHYTTGIVGPREPVWLVADVAGWPSILVDTEKVAKIVGTVVGYQRPMT